MRISEVRIRNYRSIKDLSMQLQDLTILVGSNNVVTGGRSKPNATQKSN